MKFNLDNRFTNELPADPILENTRRQVTNSCFSFVSPKQTKAPKLLHCALELGKELGLSEKDMKSDTFLNYSTGNEIIPNTKPYAMCYGGHQFGNWAGQLGDGRAINLAEIEHDNLHWTLQLKGAGETPYSRTADGLAVLRSSIREYLCSEAMHYLGIPTTRALSLSLTGDQVLRDMLYDGNAAHEPGAIVCRLAPSFLRFGSFELPASREDITTLKQLVNYTIKHHYQHLGKPSKQIYLQFFQEVADKTLDMIIHWQRVGFVHGVMNTDNLSILGLTIDYGPYGWLEGYDYDWTPNTTDRQQKRYRYSNQPNIGLWNLLKLANALYPLINETAPLEKILENYKHQFESKHQEMFAQKLGLESHQKNDKELYDQLESVLHLTETDMTLFFRQLANTSKNDSPSMALDRIRHSFYVPDAIKDAIKLKWLEWMTSYLKRLQLESISDSDRKANMDKVNPKYVLRNYMSQLAIDAAEKGDYTLIDELYTVLKKPYDEQPAFEKWFQKRPEWARHKVGCSMLSCSS